MSHIRTVALGAQVVHVAAWPLVAGVLAVVLVVVVVADVYTRRRTGALVRSAREALDRDRGHLEERIEAERARLDEEMERRRGDLEADWHERRTLLESEERRRREDALAQQERDRARIEERAREVEGRRRELDAALTRLGGLSREEARVEVLDAARSEARVEAETTARQIEQAARHHAEERAREVVATAIARCAGQVTADSTVAVVNLPSDELKGRVIGREGRNIRCLEQVTGTTVIVDDTPGVVLVSCFDPVRREVARMTLDDLVTDGRIHPGRIEQAHRRAVERIEQVCLDAADRALHDVGVTDLPEPLRPILGSLAFRTSYGQDVLAHSVECARLAASMAAEIGADVAACTRAALLHDLGKSLTPGVEGSHAAVGAELARRHGMAEEVVHAIAAHHDEIPATGVVDVITQAADAISASRPGARRESLEAHVNRLEEMEKLAVTHDGVARAFAVQAGRELRVLVEPEEVDDAQVLPLARAIADEVAGRVVVPGQVRVTVIRESRAVATAGQSTPHD